MTFFFCPQQLWFFSGVTVAILSDHFGGGDRIANVVLEETHHSPFVGFYGEEVDDWIQAAVDVH